MTIYLSLIWEFIKTGLFAIGGGLAALPFITDIGSAQAGTPHPTLPT